jgi:hypothetical protein
MKNITLSAREELIDRAREVASQQHRTLNDMFQEWLEEMSRHDDRDTSDKLNDLWSHTSYLRVRKKLSRDEMNER